MPDMNFINESLLDDFQYTEDDQKVMYTMEKKMHLHLAPTKLLILRKDFYSLNSDQWLTDTIIEAFMMTFVEKKRLYVLNSSQASSIAELGLTKSQIRKKLGEYDFIAGPVHVNKNHWALLFACVNTQTVVYIDSKCEDKRLSDRVLNNWIKFSKSKETLKGIKWRTEAYEHILQVDNNNCGVFLYKQ